MTEPRRFVGRKRYKVGALFINTLKVNPTTWTAFHRSLDFADLLRRIGLN